MDPEEAKQRTLVVAIFGGGGGVLIDEAEHLGRLIVDETHWMVLTGAATIGERQSTAVKHRALIGSGEAGRPWMGIPQTRDPLPEPPDPTGYVFRTPLGHKRNYLEAVLCDAAFAFPGAEGTLSEAVAVLCLGKPVVMIGQQWQDLIQMADDGVPNKVKNDIIQRSLTKFAADRTPAAIDPLITRDILVEHLDDMERRVALMPAEQLGSVVDKLADLLCRE